MKVLELLNFIKVQSTEVVNRQARHCPGCRCGDSHSAPDDLPVTLPVATFDDLKTLETFVHDKKNFRAAVSIETKQKSYSVCNVCNNIFVVSKLLWLQWVVTMRPIVLG